MSTPSNDGGTAFPVPIIKAYEGGIKTACEYGGGGMTLRDWFAGQALVGMRANPSLAKLQSVGAAMDAYADADAMLAVRKSIQ